MTRLALTIPMLAACFVVRGFVWHALADTACPSPCAAGAQCELVMSVPYDAEQAVLSATKSLELGDGASVRAGSDADGTVANLGQTSTSVGSNASLGGLFSNASVSLAAAAAVNGPLKTGGDVNNPSGAVIKGTVTTHRPIQADRHVLSTVTFTAGTTNVTVPSGTTRALTAGHYGATQVSAGGTLSLSAGTYYMASLTVGSDATLVLDETAGAVVIYVQSTFTFAGKEAESGGDGHVLVAIFGCEPDVLSAPFRGTVSAQNASLSLTAATFEGKFLAEGIELGPKAAVTGLTTMAPTPAQSQATSPVTTTVPTRPQSHATSPLALVPLPAPPPPVEGCYQVHRQRLAERSVRD